MERQSEPTTDIARPLCAALSTIAQVDRIVSHSVGSKPLQDMNPLEAMHVVLLVLCSSIVNKSFALYSSCLFLLRAMTV